MESRPRAIIHLDMDAFYASVEQRDNPALVGKPVIVGMPSSRSVVLAASYEARPFGVHSAMPMAWAIRKAPRAIVVRPRFHAYVTASEAVFRILETVTPDIEPLSLDEAFLDVTASRSIAGPPGNIATHLRARIAKEIGLPASAGIAEVKFVAKVASDLAKPNGQLEVAPGEARAFLQPLPVWRLWGVGKKTQEVLGARGIKFVSDVARLGEAAVQRLVGEALGTRLWELANGWDPRSVEAHRENHSIGSQDTFDEDIDDAGQVAVQLHAQALKVAQRLRQRNCLTRTVQLTVKYADFTHVTRQVSLPAATDDGQVLYRVAAGLFSKLSSSKKVRLTGVAAHGLLPAPPQGEMFSAPTSKLNAALDKIQAKFGAAAISTADVSETTIARNRRASDFQKP